MKIDSASAGELMQLSKSRQQAHQVQSVFSEVLAAAGRQGYASAQKLDSSEPLDQSIQTSWDDWFTVELGGRYASAKQPENMKQGFGEILTRAHAEGGYIQPKEFLSSLTRDELETVQNVHWLADGIDVDSLTEEGALNLLLPPAAQVDLNHDGLTRSGIAYGMRFPDSNTPPEVAAAWEETTAGMSLGERMIYELQMVLPIITANIHLDENGAFSHVVEPGDPDFVNPMAAPGYSYVQAAQDQLDHLDFVKNMITKEQYERQTDFWSRLKGSLEKHEAS